MLDVKKLLAAVESAFVKYDKPGHPFRGNQWTTGSGAKRPNAPISGGAKPAEPAASAESKPDEADEYFDEEVTGAEEAWEALDTAVDNADSDLRDFTGSEDYESQYGDDEEVLDAVEQGSAALESAREDLDEIDILVGERAARLNNVLFRRVTDSLEEARDLFNDTRVTELEDIAANIDEILEELNEIDAVKP